MPIVMLGDSDKAVSVVSHDIVYTHGDVLHVHDAAIDQIFTQEIVVEQLTYNADVPISSDEFLYIVGIREGAVVTATDIKKAFFYLQKKNRYKEIRLHIVMSDHGVQLHFNIVGLWIFERLKIKGLLIGKDSYRRFYVIDPGDPFDLEKHTYSLQKIQETFKNEGYFNGTVTATIQHNYCTKSVTVCLDLHKGPCFKIDTVELTIQVDEDNTSDSISFIKEYLYKKYLRSLRKTYYAKESLNKQSSAIKDYLAHNGFLHVTIELAESINYDCARVRVHMMISIHHKRTFTFFGAHFFSHDQLYEHIMQFGRSAWLLPIAIVAEEISKLYHDKGFWQIKIETQEDDNHYVFVIKEGMRARIKDICITGAHYEKTTQLVKHCFSQLLRKKYIDKERLDDALQALDTYYKNAGFVDFKIMHYECVPTDIADYYVLDITIDEGIQTCIKNITIPMLPALSFQGPFKEVNKKIRKKKEIPLTRALLQEQHQWLAQYFHKHGYGDVSIKPDVIYDEHRNATLVWQIDGVVKTLVGKTIIQGVSVIPTRIMQRSLCYADGDTWNYDQLKHTFVQLKDLEVFESIHVNPILNPYDIHEHIMLLKMHNDDPYEVRVRGGIELQHVQQYQTLSGLTYKVGGTFIMKNPLNRCDQLRFDADFARSHREIVVRYRWPCSLLIPFIAMLQGYSIRYEQPGFIGNNKNIYTITQNGLLLALNKKGVHIDSGINLGFEIMETIISTAAVGNRTFADQLARAINFEPALLEKHVPFIFVEPTLLFDYLDNKLNPTRGSLTLLSIKGMFPLHHVHKKDTFFVRVLAEQSWFIPLYPLVAAFRVRLGHIFYQQFSAIMPTERFYLGGSHSLRSYDTDLAPPLGEFRDERGRVHAVPQGGKTMVNVNLELRFPLFKSVGGVLFQDFGVLSGTAFTDFSPDHLLAGTGFGLRYYTPIGPLRFDIGWKWHVLCPLERSYAWFLTFGHAF